MPNTFRANHIIERAVLDELTHRLQYGCRIIQKLKEESQLGISFGCHSNVVVLAQQQKVHSEVVSEVSLEEVGEGESSTFYTAALKTNKIWPFKTLSLFCRAACLLRWRLLPSPPWTAGPLSLSLFFQSISS